MAGKQLAYIRYGMRKLRHSLTHYVVSLPVIHGSATAGNELQMRSIETAISGEAQASCHSNQLSVSRLHGFSKSTRSMNPFHRMCHVELYKPGTSCTVYFYIRYNAHTLSETWAYIVWFMFKNQHDLFVTTQSNVNRFSEFFHWHISKEIHYKCLKTFHLTLNALTCEIWIVKITVKLSFINQSRVNQRHWFKLLVKFSYFLTGCSFVVAV